MSQEKYKYYLIYQIENKLNGMIYIGCHVTTNPKDKYMGSGTNIRKAIKQFGLENFTKSILYCFDNEKEMLDKEAELVNREFIANPNTYNIIIGGGNFLTLDTIAIKDKDGNMFRVHKNDPRYLSGDLVGVTTGFINVKDKDGNTFQVDIDDSRYLSGELVGVTTGLFMMKDKDGNTLQITKNDPRYLSEELVGVTTGMVTVKDKSGNTLHVHINDPRYLTGELVPIWKDRKHTEETKKKIGKANSIKQKGENNSQFGKTKSDESKQKIKDKLCKTFYVFDLNNNFLSEEKNINEYARLNNLNPSSIVKVLNGKYKQTGGFKFTYTLL